MYVLYPIELEVANLVESEVNRRAIQRYLITLIQESIYIDDKGRKQAEKVGGLLPSRES